MAVITLYSNSMQAGLGLQYATKVKVKAQKEFKLQLTSTLLASVLVKRNVTRQRDCRACQSHFEIVKKYDQSERARKQTELKYLRKYRRLNVYRNKQAFR